MASATVSRLCYRLRRLATLAVAMALLAALVPARPAQARQEVHVSSWSSLCELLEYAESFRDGVVIYADTPIYRQYNDPDLVLSGGDVILELGSYRLDANAIGERTDGGRVLTVLSGTLVLRGYHNSDYTGVCGGSADIGGGILVSGGNLRVEGCKIHDNKGGLGGGIAVTGGTCTLDDVSVYDNTADRGGGVYVGPYGTLIVSGGEVLGNTAERGGGVYTEGTGARIEGCTIARNTADLGGGLSVEGGDTTISGGEQYDNSARLGGGVAVLSGVFMLYNGVITKNAASCGAGIAVLGGSAYIEDGEFSLNVASHKGGAAFVDQGTLSVRGGEFITNRAEAVEDEWGETETAEGGGFYVATGASFELEGSPEVWNNRRGGILQAVFLEADAVINVKGSFSPKYALGVDVADLPDLGQVREIASVGSYGEGAFACAAYDCEYVFETTGDGRGHALIRRVKVHEGVRVSSWADLAQRLRALKRGEEGSFWLDGNITFGSGEPAAFARRSLEVRRNAKVTIDLNGFSINRGLSQQEVPTDEDSERCLYVSTGELTIHDRRGGGRITGGCCQRGGGVFVAEGKLTMDGGEITGNKATYGGGVYVGNGTFELLGGSIVNNVGLAKGMPCGGGVYVGDNSDLPKVEAAADEEDESEGEGASNEIAVASMIVRGATTRVMNNRADGWGAGVCIVNGSFDMDGAAVMANLPFDDAGQGGGGIYASNGSTISIVYGAVAENRVRNGSGGAIVLEDGCKAELNGTIVSFNSCDQDGGAICARSSDVEIRDINMHSNKAGGSGGAVALTGSSNGRFLSGEIYNNQSGQDGGAICAESSDVEIRDINIYGNKAGGSGGAVALTGSSNGSILSGAFHNNRVYGNGGAVNVGFGSRCEMSGGEVYENVAWPTDNVEDNSYVEFNNYSWSKGHKVPPFSAGGGLCVEGELIVKGGKIVRNNAVMGCGICFYDDRPPNEYQALTLSGSPDISGNYVSPRYPTDVRDIEIWEGTTSDEGLVRVEGTFEPPTPVCIAKNYRFHQDYIPLVAPGNYDVGAFKCVQDALYGSSSSYYILKIDSDGLGAYLIRRMQFGDSDTDGGTGASARGGSSDGNVPAAAGSTVTAGGASSTGASAAASQGSAALPNTADVPASGAGACLAAGLLALAASLCIKSRA